MPRRFEDHLQGREGEILLAAFHCVVEKGIAGTSTHAVAARAGHTQGIIHYYFKSKEDLLKRVMEILFQNFIENIETIAKSDLTPIQKLEGILESGYSFLGSRKDEFIVMIAFWAHAVAVGGDMLSLYQDLFRRFRAAVIETLKEGERKMAFRQGTSKDVALLIVAGVQGMGIQYALNLDRPAIERCKTFLKELLRHVSEG